MIESITQIAWEAGARILEYYGREGVIETKADSSPLTLADRASHELISEKLRRIDPSIPVLSEESPDDEIRGRKKWNRFWLVDPLDGTKEFLKKTGEFTVNIALVEAGVPVLGVIYAPAREWTYCAERNGGARKRTAAGDPVAIHVRRADESRLAVVASRDHAGPQVKELLLRFPQAEAKSMGSSLKFCLIAEGKADLYLRDVPTMEWDVGAAQCIVEAAGGVVLSLDKKPLRYNKDDLRNPSLLTAGDPAFAAGVLDWLSASPPT